MVYRGPCNHPYCRDCLQGCINAALESNQLPAKCCNEPFGMAVVRVAVSLDKFNTYRDRLEELTADPNELFYCPKPRCAARITVPAGRGNEPLTCPTCRTKVCRKCRKEDHRGECKDDDGEEKLKELVGKEGWKSCPHCGRVVEKAGFGCNVMHCVCGNHWCWVCGKAKPLVSLRFHHIIYV